MDGDLEETNKRFNHCWSELDLLNNKMSTMMAITNLKEQELVDLKGQMASMYQNVKEQENYAFRLRAKVDCQEEVGSSPHTCFCVN